MIKETSHFQFASRIETIDEATMRAAEFARARGFSDDALFAIDMATRETVANAVTHGNRQDETKTVDVTFSLNNDELTITVRDYGAGFNPDEVPDPTTEANLMQASGRGMLFIRNFMDSVTWRRHAEGGTLVEMKKRRV